MSSSLVPGYDEDKHDGADEHDNVFPEMRRNELMTHGAAPPVIGALSSDVSAPKMTFARTAKPIAVEEFAFERARLLAAASSTLPLAVARERRGRVTRATELVGGKDAADGGPWADATYSGDESEELTVAGPPKDVDTLEVQGAKRRKQKKSRETLEEEALAELLAKATSLLHGLKTRDYQNRAFCDPRRMPTSGSRVTTEHGDAKDGEDTDEEYEIEPLEEGAARMLGGARRVRRFCGEVSHRRGRAAPTVFPSRVTAEYAGHSQGISRLRVWGDLMLTAGLDGAVLLWDVSHERNTTVAEGLCDSRGAIRSYLGHSSLAVKDCWFRSDGASFLSAGYDGATILWDTETGIARRAWRFAAGPVNAVRTKPDEDDLVLVACTDRRLRHFDAREPGNKPAQTYEYHLSSVNAAVFCDRARRFASSGDDRQVLVWDFRVPAPIKIFSEVSQPSIPTLACHPDTTRLVGVALDNKFATFKISSTSGKVSRGHEFSPVGFDVGGHACEPGFSPDGNLIACGDAKGAVWCMNLASGARIRSPAGVSSGEHRLDSGAHRRVPVCTVAWHPVHRGVLFSGGWDGKVVRWGPDPVESI